MKILGINAFYHDSASCLLIDGEIKTAVEEERFSRVKHDNNFPFKGIDYCLKSNNLTINDIDYIAYYEKPLLKFERILETFVATWPFSLKPFVKGMPEWLVEKIKIEDIFRKKLGFKGKIYYFPHHLSHASAGYFSSNFDKSAILVIDGVGEWQTVSLWEGEKNKLYLIKSINFPHSLGLLYSTFTSFLGFQVNEGEYKMMGLAAYGKPKYINKIKKIIRIFEDGSFELNLKYFSFRESFQMFSKKFIKLFGPPREKTEDFTQRHADIATSIQKITEEIYFKILNHLFQLTKEKNLCISGGVGLNSLANGKIYQNTPFKNIWVFGPAGDSGTAIGSALCLYSFLTGKRPNAINNLYLGSSYSESQIEAILKSYSLKYKKFLNEEELIDKVVDLLAKGKIIGWFQGKMEFGPRALGSRSILCRPWPRKMKDKINKIKKRENFRPFAGSVLQEKVAEFFEVPENNHYSPFMTFCFKVKKEKEKQISAIVHVDKTCRIQTVNEKDNGLYYKLIKKFYEKTNIPCILNTSFNLKGEPIVENPKQAIEDFLKTEMDYLVMEEFLVSKD